ncbi:hypothetical protein Goari_008273 [Gossypium aridum]|uniref:Uncharacterized protein n=1 Tax=Gossypium aridum TaxID=34290 RepID=A0A7J8XTH4_GOSAI|nr:hypothetical protein [Gossypium aridum]
MSRCSINKACSCCYSKVRCRGCKRCTSALQGKTGCSSEGQKGEAAKG